MFATLEQGANNRGKNRKTFTDTFKKVEKANILFEILKEVKAPLTYKGLSNKRYPEFVYKNIIDENSSKESSSNSIEEESSTYGFLPF
jgi:hypothetical protein